MAFVTPEHSDWRFSLVKMDYSFEEGKKGKIKVKEEFTPARRWSFLVGQNENSHTAQSRLLPIMADDGHPPTLAELEDVFNIETVTKEFFIEYRNLFILVKESLDAIVKKDNTIKNNFEQNDVNTVDFAKKLLGQIVFLYFLQKKGWFGVAKKAAWGTGSKQFLRELFEKKHGDYNNFFNDILEPLFYEALRLDRGHEDHYYSRFNCKIPFLNGGLFDPIKGYDWVNTDILLANELFSNKKKTKEGDTGNGILDVFDRYNFTVKEDEPLEKEVAIDPELLGKAYEKFNAIRPDNFEEYINALKSGKKGDESKFNKQYGVYYTPREIVHYMCQRSLINYLAAQFDGGAVIYEKPGDEQIDLLGNDGKKGQLDLTIEHTEKLVISKEDIETLIHLGEILNENEEIALIKQQKITEGQQQSSTYKLKLPEDIRRNAKTIDEKLASIKVCDPAIGSGAFPVGMMGEIVRARNVLSNFIKGTDRTAYHFKRECIEKSLYGVDIDSGAVEIAKLRLWLSLVLDFNINRVISKERSD
ncbi:MAG: DNA methyltransferase [Smithella sp.]